jgi:hypothetical protein
LSFNCCLCVSDCLLVSLVSLSVCLNCKSTCLPVFLQANHEKELGMIWVAWRFFIVCF